MAFLDQRERELLEAISRLTYCNPFLGERIEWERRALGEAFTPFFAVWHPRADLLGNNPNVQRIAELAAGLAETLRGRLAAGAEASGAEVGLYRDLVLYLLYARYQERFLAMILGERARTDRRRAGFYREFRADFDRYLDLPPVPPPARAEPEHVFACFFQVRRAFFYTFHSIAGSSMPAARLRAQVWQSVFTHDLRRFQRSLYARMGDVTTLVTGPSGTGKELVARAIGLSRYIPFDPGEATFRESYEESFFPLNLSALSPTLIESELFGHRRGAFTGAVADRVGWFEVCPPLGTVFLDEIAEIDVAVQVKLLRVLETRTFQRLGATDDRRFRGKVIAATNRDLGVEMRAGRFREDLYYRLCSDVVAAPSLHERIADSPEELPALALFLAQRLAGDDEAPELAREVEEWVERELGRDYPWPGNVRELAQCVSNVLIRREYRPAAAAGGTADVRGELAREFTAGELPAEEVLRRYCTLVYARAGSYQEAARRLGLDRRTVKSRVDGGLLARLHPGGVASASRR
jgi:transcriptional regulator with AAA-type ATPase domain